MFTVQTARVLRALLDGHRYGRAIIVATGLKSGTIHPILMRLERDGWLTSQAEQFGTARPGRPARRYYEITDAARVRAALADITDQIGSHGGEAK